MQGATYFLKYEKRYWYRYSNNGYPNFKETKTKLLTARLDCNTRKGRNQKKPKPHPLPPVTPAGVKKSKLTKNQWIALRSMTPTKNIPSKSKPK